MSSNFNFQVLDETKAYIQQLETSNASLKEQLANAQLLLTASEEERKAIKRSDVLERFSVLETEKVMLGVISGHVRFEIVDRFDESACVGFIVLHDNENSESTLKVKLTLTRDTSISIERTIKIQYFQEIRDVKPKDILVLQGGWKINGVYDRTVWIYEEYCKRNVRISPPLAIDQNPTKKTKVDTFQLS